jgi:aspartate carbamoyltransferase
MSKGPFEGRTISVVHDLSVDEQIYLYKKTRELKEAFRRGTDLSEFRIDDRNVGLYLIFLEDSTRTKESFRNAAAFHNVKLASFDAEYSSFNKMESYADTFRMLCGYSWRSVFVVRSKLEGVCRWLDQAIGEYALRNEFPKPSFINAGDGKHEHPTQEFLDEFSFYEQKGWKTDRIKIALIGDLYHGRTTHSKASGLRVFGEVEVDLVAPEELGMPDHYLGIMEANGFRIRRFSSLEEYLGQKDIADIWYFTRLQLERMGEDVLEKAEELRESVSFKPAFLEKLPEGTRFYHPLPRHREHPAIPFSLDRSPVNGWEGQAVNGYYTRIVEIAMLGGKLGGDFEGAHPEEPDYVDDFVENVTPVVKAKPGFKIGILPITDGIFIDHIGKGDDVATIWDHINNIRELLDLNFMSSHGVFRSQKDGKFKGIVALPEAEDFDEKKLKKLAAIAPGCTLNIIRRQKVVKKYRLHMPPRIYNFDEISCKNPDCISFPSHHEYASTVFYRAARNTFTCRYCEKPHRFKEIWDL